ncbi:MAG TPA: lantibiotic dehydratase [Planctomycetota bacterium]|nr:lantibiotic dehydratase [Planctomycetota bacterium]
MTNTGTPAAFAPSGFFVLRAPALPFAAFAGGAAGEAARAKLRRLVERPDVREALFVASPDLDARLETWRSAPDSEDGARIELSLWRYVARMAGRATPFGLFGSCSLGAIGATTHLVLGDRVRRHTRLDMDYVVLLADALARDSTLRPRLRFRPNSSLCRVGERWRYHEVRREAKGWAHRRCALEAADYLDAVLARARGGATVGELVATLRERDADATEAETAEYVGALIDQQVLVSELVPAITGDEPIHDWIARLRATEGGAAAAERLEAVRDELARFDAGGPGVAPLRYRALAASLSELPAEVDVARTFQVDLTRPAPDAALGSALVAELQRGVELLRRIAPRPDDSLANFRRAFCERFGDTPVTREVPLSEALDDETGVGDGGTDEVVSAAPILDGLELAAAETPAPFGARERHLLERVTGLLQRGATEWSLTDDDVEKLAVDDPPPLPDAFAAHARIEAASAEAVDRGDFRLLLQGASGPSGARLLGRFGHADPELADAVAGHLRAEEALRPDALFAEIVHLPEGRVGNILARPTHRGHEICYLGRSSLPEANQIELGDLLVSVRGGRVVLRSKRHGREVLPRLTTAHNYSAQPGVYRFLCGLQEQGVAGGLAWHWGALANSAFLPRVTHGRLVLARAQWRVAREESARLIEAGTSARPAALAAWRAERRLPRWVCLTEGDHELPIDLEEPALVATLLAQMRGRDATLTELFPAPDLLCVTGPEGRHVHEILVPFVRCAAAEAPRRARPSPTTAVARRFAPGSEWLTVKLYGGALAVDDLVRTVVGPLAVELAAEGVARRWHFVRYADPHGHLRLRFQGEACRLEPELLPRLRRAVAPLLDSNLLWKLQIDTYEREIERYGGPEGIALCEELFHFDSEAIVGLLRDAPTEGDGDRRWRLALLGMDRLLDDLGLDLETRRRTLLRARDAFHSEFKAGDAVARQIGAKWRAESAAVARLLAPAGDEEDAGSPERAAFARRSERSAAARAALQRAAADGSLAAPLEEIASSLLHMHCNRLLRAAARTHELVLYDFLHRHYKGRVARAASGRRGALVVPDARNAPDVYVA